MMRSLIVFSDVTVDGFMAGSNGDLDFMVDIADDPQLVSELTGKLLRTADTIVVGRNSFAAMAAYWSNAEGEVAAWLNETPKVVLSTNPDLDVSEWRNSTLAAGDGVKQVRRLKGAAGGSVVTFGGVRTVRSLVRADLVDEYWLKINPAVVGRGQSMFSDLVTHRLLTLRSARAFPNGAIAATYWA